jgi:hypothetical protein
MELWTSGEPLDCEHGESRITCPVCQPKVAALTDAIALVVCVAAVVWFVVIGARADDAEHASSLWRARPQIERASGR